MPTSTLKQIRQKLRGLADEQVAAHSQRFFKTGPGEYGEGDQFMGIRVPELRRLSKEYRDLPLAEVEQLVQSLIHEERLLGLLLLVTQYQRADAAGRKLVFDSYVQNMANVNNWDLVDCSAHLIVGPQLRDRSKRPLYRWAKSNNLWQRRISIMATYSYIKEGDFEDTLTIAELLLNDEEDLIHKAVGWMLREIGNRDRSVEETFLKDHYSSVPRTMLRYAIERFPEKKRKRYLTGKI